MKLGLVIYSNDPETVWNAFRFGNFSIKQGDEVKVFLLAKGVECESLDSEDFNITEQARGLIDSGGKIFACGTCLKLRNTRGSDICPISSMKDLYQIVKECEKIMTF